MNVQINFGALAPTIREQLKAQGFKVPAHRTRTWQQYAQSVGYLYVQGVLSEGETKAARNRIFRDIKATLPESVAK